MLSGNTIITTDASLNAIKHEARDQAIKEYKEALLHEFRKFYVNRLHIEYNDSCTHFENICRIISSTTIE